MLIHAALVAMVGVVFIISKHSSHRHRSPAQYLANKNIWFDTIPTHSTACVPILASPVCTSLSDQQYRFYVFFCKSALH